MYIKRKLRDKNKIKKYSLVSLGRGLIVEWALRLSTKLKTPVNVSDVPDLAKLELYRTKWNRIRGILLEIIEKSNLEILKSDIFKHPSVGEMDMTYTLKFMQAHFEHHK